MRKIEIEYCTVVLRIRDYCVGIKNAVVVVVFIFIKHNSMFGQTRSSFQLCTINTVHTFSCRCNANCVHVTSTVVAVHGTCEGPR